MCRAPSSATSATLCGASDACGSPLALLQFFFCGCQPAVTALRSDGRRKLQQF